MQMKLDGVWLDGSDSGPVERGDMQISIPILMVLYLCRVSPALRDLPEINQPFQVLFQK